MKISLIEEDEISAVAEVILQINVLVSLRNNTQSNRLG